MARGQKIHANTDLIQENYLVVLKVNLRAADEHKNIKHLLMLVTESSCFAGQVQSSKCSSQIHS